MSRSSLHPNTEKGIVCGSFLALALWGCSASSDETTTQFGSTETTTDGAGGSAVTGAGGAGGQGEGGFDLTAGVGGSVAGVDVDVVITADNAYSFGYGDESGINNFTQGSRAQTAGEIFNCGVGPEAFTVPAAEAPASAYLYIVTWDDLSVTQGVLGQFSRGGGQPIYTGDPEFDVCATGVNMQSSQTGPTQAEINVQIGLCNSGAGDPATTSAGWVNTAGAVTQGALGTLAVGEANDVAAGGTFPPTCPTGVAPAGVASIDPASHWMWYQPGGVADPFQSTGSNTFRAYLIFRVAGGDIPTPR